MEILRACSKRIQTLQHRLDVAEQNAAIYRGFRDDEARMKTSFIEQIDKYMDLLKQTYGCCHCAKGFGCYFEKKCLEGHPSLCPTLQTMSLSAHISFVRRSANIEELHSKDS
ncbi:hypothetical protein V3481_007263 [Fusarium oxysporum f. sp. vasinfectum]